MRNRRPVIDPDHQRQPHQRRHKRQHRTRRPNRGRTPTDKTKPTPRAADRRRHPGGGQNSDASPPQRVAETRRESAPAPLNSRQHGTHRRQHRESCGNGISGPQLGYSQAAACRYRTPETGTQPQQAVPSSQRQSAYLRGNRGTPSRTGGPKAVPVSSSGVRSSSTRASICNTL